MDSIEVRISDDKMKASILLLEREEGAYTEEELSAELKKNNVKMGIDKELLKNIVEQKLYGQRCVVAEGKKPTQGSNGFYVFNFDVNAESGKPRVQEDGTVSYSQLIELVTEGDLVATYIPAQQGTFGYDVCGSLLKPEKCADLPPLKGKNIIREENVYKAGSNGRVSLKDGEVVIKKVLEINGNLNNIFGDIDYSDDVMINGDVEAGMSIKAQGNVYITGYTEGAAIEAGGDVVVDCGINGGKVTAGRNLKSKYIQYSEIETGGDVETGAIVNSDIKASGFVKALISKGKVYGGKIIALKGIEALNIGRKNGVRTEVYAGMLPDILEEMESLEGKIVALRHELKIMEQVCQALNKKDEAQRKIFESRRVKILGDKFLKEKDLNEKLLRYKELAEKVKEGKQAQIIAREHIYPEVEIVLYKSHHVNQTELEGIVYTRQHGDVVAEHLT